MKATIFHWILTSYFILPSSSLTRWWRSRLGKKKVQAEKLEIRVRFTFHTVLKCTGFFCYLNFTWNQMLLIFSQRSIKFVDLKLFLLPLRLFIKKIWQFWALKNWHFELFRGSEFRNLGIFDTAKCRIFSKIKI